MRANTDGNRRGANSKNRRRSSGILDEPAIEALLRDLALSLPDAEEASIQDQVAALSKAFGDRSGKTTDVVRGAQESFEMSVTSRLDDARLAIQLLRDSVLAESPFGEVKMVDPEFEESVVALARDVEGVKERLDGVVEKKALAKSVTKDEFVQRWS
jgi:hypothetical protein